MKTGRLITASFLIRINHEITLPISTRRSDKRGKHNSLS